MMHYGLEYRERDTEEWLMADANEQPNTTKCALAAIHALWPAFKPAAPEPTPDDQITWSFDAPKEDIDIARILREAQEKGAFEVAIKVGDKSMTYIHRSVDGLCNAWAEATGRPTLDGFDSIVDGCFLDVFGWSRSRFPMLAQATSWRNLQEQAAAQQKPKVRVTVTGVK